MKLEDCVTFLTTPGSPSSYMNTMIVCNKRAFWREELLKLSVLEVGVRLALDLILIPMYFYLHLTRRSTVLLYNPRLGSMSSE